MSSFGALVISLDFELLWGVRDRYPSGGGSYAQNLLGVRTALPRLLNLFAEFDVAATWATVGLLFARSRGDVERFSPPPALRPRYQDASLCAYREHIGDGEADDPLHFAPSLIELVRQTPRQEIGTHTFSHYYCLDRGQDAAAFAADLDSARRIAGPYGIGLRSIVFPRNQHNADYDAVLLANGIGVFRGNPLTWMWGDATPEKVTSFWKRGGRLLDSYVNLSGPYLADWSQILQPNGLANVPASCSLRPYTPRLRHLEGLRRRRLANALRKAARTNRIFHLWWHPHNFGIHIDENLAFLRTVLLEFDRCRREHGMRSLSMSEVADIARAGV